MGSTRLKIKYEEEAPYGSTEIRTLYIKYIGSCDGVVVYDDKGECLFSYTEWGNRDLGKAIVTLLTNFSPEHHEDIEYWNKEDLELIENKNK